MTETGIPIAPADPGGMRIAIPDNARFARIHAMAIDAYARVAAPTRAGTPTPA